jgi:hypothetical protein
MFQVGHCHGASARMLRSIPLAMSRPGWMGTVVPRPLSQVIELFWSDLDPKCGRSPQSDGLPLAATYGQGPMHRVWWRLLRYGLQVTIPALADHRLATLTWHIC